MTKNSAILRVDIFKPEDPKADAPPETDKGAKIGDTEERLQSLHPGQTKIEPHHYTGPEGHYVLVSDSTGKVRLVFETDQKKVVTFRVGREPAVEYVEGCQ